MRGSRPTTNVPGTTSTRQPLDDRQAREGIHSKKSNNVVVAIGHTPQKHIPWCTYHAPLTIMRLLTHNFLQSNVRGTTKGYPLKIVPSQILVEDSPVDTELVRKVLPKLQYSAVVAAVAEIYEKVDPKPPAIPNTLAEDGDEVEESVLEALHHVLFNIHILEGELICPDTQRKFPIKQGIPNMILHEDEI